MSSGGVDGDALGDPDGVLVGDALGDPDGVLVGDALGDPDGVLVGRGVTVGGVGTGQASGAEDGTTPVSGSAKVTTIASLSGARSIRTRATATR
jgi:hypothetical protein